MHKDCTTNQKNTDGPHHVLPPSQDRVSNSSSVMSARIRSIGTLRRREEIQDKRPWRTYLWRKTELIKSLQLYVLHWLFHVRCSPVSNGMTTLAIFLLLRGVILQCAPHAEPLPCCAQESSTIQSPGHIWEQNRNWMLTDFWLRLNSFPKLNAGIESKVFWAPK